MEVESSTNTTLTGAAIDELVRENKLLKGKVQSLESDLRDAQIIIRELKGRARTLTQRIHAPNIADEVLRTDRSVKFYTGFVSLAMFQAALTFLLSVWQPKLPTRLQPEEQFLMVLMRLLLGLLTEDLSYRFAVPLCTVSKIFHAWIDVMAHKCGKLVVWPTRKAIKRNLPEPFKDPAFEKLRGILDCSEVCIQKPAFLQARSQTYSRYKHHNTLKFLVSIAIRIHHLCVKVLGRKSQ